MRLILNCIIGMLLLWLAVPTLILAVGFWQCMHQWGWL